MNSLDTVHRRALITASLTFSGILILIFLYWRGASKGSLPSLAQPLVQKLDLVATNTSPAKAVPVVALPADPAPKTLPHAKASARTESKQQALPPTVAKPKLADVTSLAEATDAMTRTPPKPGVTNVSRTTSSSARAVVSKISTNVTAEDQRVARQWLANTNERPVIRVQYRAGDVVRLTTELGRALLVAGGGTTNRKEFFLEPSSKAPLFAPFSKAVAKRFADYSLALNPSPAFEPLTQVLPAYFGDQDYDLAFVPDHTLATEIFAKVANAARSVPKQLADANGIVFEGKLQLSGTQPTFMLLEAKRGTNRHVFVAPPDTEEH